MSNKQQQIVVPASLIEAVGTGVDTKGVIGKRIRITSVPEINPIVEIIMGPAPFKAGAEGTVFHIAEDGQIWVDFGDDETVRTQGPDDQRLWDIGSIHDEVLGAGGEVAVTYEFIPEEGDDIAQAA